MPIPEMTPQQKYEHFCHTHPQYKNMSINQICSIMVKEKILNEYEVAELKKPIFDFKQDADAHSWKPKGYENMGLYIGSSQDKNKTTPTNYVEKPKKYHPQFQKLEINDNGKVNISAYSFENLKKQYNKNKYNVVKDSNNGVSVTDKKGQLVVSISSNYFGKQINFYDGENSESIVLNKKNEITEYYTQTESNGKKTFKMYDVKSKFPYKIVEEYSNGSRKTTNLDKKSGQIRYQDYWKPGNDCAEWFTEYTDGKPYKTGSYNSEMKYLLVNDLVADITAKNTFGLPTTRPSIKENVLKRITSENVQETVEQYKKLTGNELIDDIHNEIGLDSDLKKQLINHIENLYVKEMKDSNAHMGKFIASRLKSDIAGLGSGDIEKHINMITNENLQFVFQSYISDQFERDDIWEKRKGLLTEINDEVGLGDKRQEIFQKLINVATEKLNNTVKQDILNDIASHSNDLYLVEKDIIRAVSISNGGDLRNKNNQTKITKPNGKFDGNIKQGRIGDCWLVAGTICLLQKEYGRNLLEKAITIDKKTGDAIVTFKGYGKKYRISAELIKDSNYLASGDGDMRIIEIAMDRYKKEQSYNRGVPNTWNSYDNINIDGGNEIDLFKALDSNISKTYIDKNINTYNFNNEKSFYMFGLPSFGGFEDIPNVATDSLGNKVDIIKDHAYTIVGSDKDNIYFINPWDSSNKLSVPRHIFEEHNIQIQCYTSK